MIDDVTLFEDDDADTVDELAPPLLFLTKGNG